MSVMALPFVGIDPAVSEEARVVSSLANPASVGRAFSLRREWALDDVWRDSRVPNWDGYGAAPVTFPVLATATTFLAALPETWPSPEIAADPDGEISFEWARDSHWLFAVTVSGDRRLSYAGMFGLNRVHGAENFDGRLPRAIVVNLVRFFSGTASNGS